MLYKMNHVRLCLELLCHGYVVQLADTTLEEAVAECSIQ